MSNLLYNEDTYKIIGICMEVHRQLGKGFNEAVSCLTDSHIKQTLNYLEVSKLKLGLLINFGEDSLKHRRVIL